MRWLFLLLLVANALIYFWGSSKEQQLASSEGILENAGMGNLRLLSEVETVDETYVRQQPQIPETVSDEAVPQTSTPEPVISADLPKERVEDVVVTTKDPGSIIESSVEDGIADTTALQENPVQEVEKGQAADEVEEIAADVEEPSPAPEVPQVKAESPEITVEEQPLSEEEGVTVVELGESEPKVGHATESPDVNTVEVEAVPEPEPIPIEEAFCGILGPLEERRAAQTIVAEMTARDIEASLRQAPMRKPKGYWVMIPPMASQPEAVERFKVIKAMGITDIKRFVQGEYRNGISFGVFSRQVNALNRQQTLKKRGVDVDIVPRYSEITGFWVDFKAFSESFEILSGKLSEKYPQQKIEKQSCPRIVTR